MHFILLIRLLQHKVYAYNLISKIDSLQTIKMYNSTKYINFQTWGMGAYDREEDLMIQCKLDPLTTSFVRHKNICMVEDRWTASGKQAITNHLLLKWMQRSRK